MDIATVPNRTAGVGDGDGLGDGLGVGDGDGLGDGDGVPLDGGGKLQVGMGG